MATATKTKQTADHNVTAAAERIREVNEPQSSAKGRDHVPGPVREDAELDRRDYQEKVGEKSQVDWVTTIANTQEEFTRELASAYSSAARSLIK